MEQNTKVREKNRTSLERTSQPIGESELHNDLSPDLPGLTNRLQSEIVGDGTLSDGEARLERSSKVDVSSLGSEFGDSLFDLGSEVLDQSSANGQGGRVSSHVCRAVLRATTYWMGQAAASPKAQMVCPSTCLVISTKRDKVVCQVSIDSEKPSDK